MFNCPNKSLLHVWNWKQPSGLMIINYFQRCGFLMLVVILKFLMSSPKHKWRFKTNLEVLELLFELLY